MPQTQNLNPPKHNQNKPVPFKRLASAGIVALGVLLAEVLGSSVLGVWVGIVMLLFPSFLVPFALRWFWGRFNGVGFAGGVIGGFAAALYFSLADPAGWNEATRFLAIAGISGLVSVGSTFATVPVDREHLQTFYDQVRPFGWWPRGWRESHRAEHRSELRLLGLTLVWQIVTFLLPMGVVLGMWRSVVPAAILWIGLSWLVMRRPRSVASTLPV
jgi:solute:Na+ symporter, SSS family